jgi:hypothetical protein
VRLLIALALLVSISPGVSEVIEAGVHLVVHGDLPHHEADSDRHCSEHTCTPLAHHCGCHSTMSAQPSVRTASPVSTGGVTRIDPTAVAAVFSRASEPPPLRPPIA